MYFLGLIVYLVLELYLGPDSVMTDSTEIDFVFNLMSALVLWFADRDFDNAL